MMHSLMRLILCVIALSLIACSSPKISVTRAHDLAVCKKKCEQRLNACQRECRNSCPRCTFAANRSTAQHYGRYLHERCVQGGIIMRDMQSYRDPLQCRKATCNCSADYQVCAQSCTGMIYKHLQVAPACC